MTEEFEKERLRNGGAAGFVTSPQVRTASDDDGMILLDLRSGRYTAFNPVGALVWAALEKGSPEVSIVRQLRERFDVPGERIERDVEAILATLKTNGWIVPARIDRPPASATESGAGSSASDPPAMHRLPTDAAHAEAGVSAARELYWRLIALLALIYIDILMRLRFRRLYDVLRTCPKSSARLDAGTLRQICRCVNRAASAYFKRAWCLQRSAACVYLLRRRGIPAQLVLGVRTFPFEAHAWAELDGQVLNDTPEYTGGFLVLDRI